MEVSVHPLVGQLRPVFAEICASPGIALSSAIIKLEHLIEEEGDSLFHRNNAHNAQTKVLQHWINRQLEEMAAKRETRDAVGLCIRALMNVEYIDVNARTQFFSTILETVIQEANPVSSAFEAAKVWGELLVAGSSIAEGIVSSRLQKCIAIIHEKRPTPTRELTTSLFVEEILRHTPNLVTVSGSDTFELTRHLIHSSTAEVREHGAITLQLLLQTSYASNSMPRWQEWTDTLLADVGKGVQSKLQEAQHAALLIFCSVLIVTTARKRDAGGAPALTLSSRAMAMFNEVWQHVAKSIASDFAVMPQEIRNEILETLPLMARFDGALFVKATLNDVVATASCVFRATSGPDERGPMFLMVDKLAAVLPELVPVFADRMMIHIENAMVNRPKRDRRPEAVTCFATMATVSPKCIRPFLQRNLGPLFAGQPTVEFARDVARICVAFPELRSTCLSRMLDTAKAQIFWVRNSRNRGASSTASPVSSASQKEDGAPVGGTGGGGWGDKCRAVPGPQRSPSPASAGDPGMSPQLGSTDPRRANAFTAGIAAPMFPHKDDPLEEACTQKLLTCLNVLKSLEFTGFSTLPFLSEVVVDLVRDPNEEVRRAAISLCFQLLLSGCEGPQSPCTRTEGGVMIHQGHGHMRLIVDITKQLISAAVSDPESDIRLYTLEKLTADYDQTLASHELVSALLPALHDKHQNRLAVVALLGRVSQRNPSCVFHMLRNVMVQCATEIKYFSNIKTQEHAITLLGTVVQAAPTMAQPYVSALLRDCIRSLQDPLQLPTVLTALLFCIGKLVRLADGDDVEMVRAIRPCVISHILDPSWLPKKQEAIRALAEITRATHDVSLYVEFPQLLPVLLSALHGGFKETWPVRQDVLQLMGVIGAVDPLTVKETARALRDRSGNEGKSVSYYRNRGEEAIAQTVLREVLEALKLPSMQDEQGIRAVEAVVSILACREISAGALVPFYASVVTTFLQHARAHPKVRDKLLAQFTRLVGVAKQHIRIHLEVILSTITDFLSTSDPDVLSQALGLFLELRRSLHEEFKPYISTILPPLVGMMDPRHSLSCERILNFFGSLGKMLEDHLHNILPRVVEVAGSPVFSAPCRLAAINAIVSFAKQMAAFSPHAARCIHCLCRVLKEMDSRRGPLAAQGPPATSSAREAEEQVSAAAWTALLLIGQYLGSDFEKFLPVVLPAVAARFGEGSGKFKQFCSLIGESIRLRRPHLVSGGTGAASQGDDAAFSAGRGGPSSARSKRIEDASVEGLLLALNADDRHTEDDWKQWLRQFAVELLRASPSYSHGFAYPLAQVHEPFAWHMFHSAFAACYSEMSEDVRRDVTNRLTAVLKSKKIPSEVLQELLNLAEYMERLETRYIPPSAPSSKSTGSSSSYLSAISLFDLQTLMGSSERCNLYAKALHYVEIQFFETTREFEASNMRGTPKPLPPTEWKGLMDLCEKSIYFYNLLGQRESAEGILKYVQHNFSKLTGQPEEHLLRSMDAQWFDKLQWWTQSYRAYEKQLRMEPNRVSNMVGLMRSLDSLGDYARLLSAWKMFSTQVSKKDVAELAPMGAHAAWLMQSWDEMATVTSQMSPSSYVGTTQLFYKAVLATYNRQFHEAEKLIKLCRKRLDSTLSALVAESYDRAYGIFVGIQQLSELEEIANVIRHPETLHKWQNLWERRLEGMAYEGWPGTLANHTLVLDPAKELSMWIRFVSLSRINGRDRVSNDVLWKLLGNRSVEEAIQDERNLPQPAVALATFQHVYETRKRERATELLAAYIDKVECLLKAEPAAIPPGMMVSWEKFVENLGVCHAKLGEWLAKRVYPDYCTDLATQETVFHHLHRATELHSSSGWIWHTWARLNHDIVAKWGQQQQQQQQRHQQGNPLEQPSRQSASDVQGEEVLAPHMEHIVTSAIDGYLRSACLSENLQDALGFLSLWFTYGSLLSIQSNPAIMASVYRVSASVWLKVIPQIVARIYTPNSAVMESVYYLLVLIATTHPQALLYPLNVGNMSTAAATEGSLRKAASQRVLSKIVELHHNGGVLVSEATLVCTELVRCAVLWTELWFDELERAWFLWGRERDAHVVLMTLQPLLSQLASPQTMAETHFVAEFGATLTSACDLVEKAATLGKMYYMDEAWSVFKSAVERMDNQINSMSSLAMQLISPRLLQSGKNLLIAIPGQYRESGVFPRIHSFQSTLRVMSSKQHPRRIYMNGSDGETYKFLLKGHEDLRLDERVMQLLGLVNTLLESHSTTKRRDCLIQTFSVTPLSDNAGLVGWVDNCDTLHQLIKDYRVHSKYLGTELNLMRSMYDDLGRLTVMQHVEPFEYALENTEGNDLARSSWVRAPSAESWLDRRTTYVCSLATMSMVGHILGLGDRHPSNLMIHAFSGRVVHIDFGDCFEAAQERDTFPEKVPFRLTRMLVKAMEMGGIEGFFRHSCTTVMQVLREESSSLLAMLEAFVHDPLVSWWRCSEKGDDIADDGAAAASGKAGGRNLSAKRGNRDRCADGGDNAGTGTYMSIAESFSRGRRSTNPGSPRDAEDAQRSVKRSRGAAPGTSTYVRSHRLKEQSVRQNKKAQRVLQRIKQKLEGREFSVGLTPTLVREGLQVEQQVARLIEEATSHENLCVHFAGWCPFW